ncbi:unnamed protein product, partial [Mesorhabditis spiculigera]
MRRPFRDLLPLIILLISQADGFSTFVELRQQDGEILGIAASNSTLAIAARRKIFLYRENGKDIPTPDQLLGTIDLDRAITGKVLDINMIDADKVLFCDYTSCRICSLDSKCTKLELKHSKYELRYAAASKVDDMIFVRALDETNTAWISSYKMENKNSIKPLETSEDPQFLHESSITHSFQTAEYVFFVGSSGMDYDIFNKEKDRKSEGTSQIKLTRVCLKDQTNNLESRMEIALTCGNLPARYGKVVNFASYYNKEEASLYVVARDTNEEEFQVCRFKHEEIKARFADVWNICQSTRKNESDLCRRDFYDQLPDHCLIQSSHDGNFVPCSRFQGSSTDYPDPLGNCELDRYKESAYRYGTLFDFRALNGEAIGRISTKLTNDVAWVRPDLAGSLMFGGAKGSIFRAPITNDEIKPTWLKNLTSDATHGMVLSSHAPLLYYTTPTKVLSLPLTCSSLYSTCDELLLGSFGDPIGCGWCPTDDGRASGKVVRADDKFGCSTRILTGSCPPVIFTVIYSPEHNEWKIEGKNLLSMENPDVRVCGQPCRPKYPFVNSSLIRCSMVDGQRIQEEVCDAIMYGTVGGLRMKAFHPKVLESSSGAEDTTDGSRSGGLSRAGKSVIGIVAVIGILAILAIITWYARKTYKNNKDKKRGHSDGMNLPYLPSARRFENDIERRPLNEYQAHSTGRVPTYENPYVRLQREIDPKLKIPFENLKLLEIVGSGNYGQVQRGELTVIENGKPNIKIVACKTVDPGSNLDEFVSEGLLMARLDHPRVMPLIGLAFLNELPIIVTKFMSKKDLHSYVKDSKNQILLRDIFRFAIQISEGMAYLHSRNLVHRDLAARNCMLDEQLNVCIADFGLSREINHSNSYQVIHSRTLPIRSIPLEGWSGVFTSKGDVWAYGVTLWELTSRAQYLPYYGMQMEEIREFLESGRRLSKPQHCSPLLWDVIQDCWLLDPELRPTFATITTKLHDIVRQLEAFNQTKMNAVYEVVTPSRYSQASSARSRNSETTPVSESDDSPTASLPFHSEPEN